MLRRRAQRRTPDGDVTCDACSVNPASIDTDSSCYFVSVDEGMNCMVTLRDALVQPGRDAGFARKKPGSPSTQYPDPEFTMSL